MSKMDSNDILKNVVIVLVVIGLAYLVYTLYIKKSSSVDNFDDDSNDMSEGFKEKKDSGKKMGEAPQKMVGQAMQGVMSGNMEHFTGSNNMSVQDQMDQNQIDQANAGMFPKAQLTAQELLPANEATTWSQVNPSGVGSLKDRNFLQAGYNIGINTVGQTLRNANLQLRSEPPCPQIVVGPFNNPTIEPDVSRKPFEIGGCM